MFDKKGMCMKRESGFTLIELMFVLAVAAILLSVAVPALQMFTTNSKQTGAINDFVSSMHLARNTAITTNARVTMCPSSNAASCEAVGWESGWIVFRDANSNQNVDGTDAIIATGSPSDGPTIASAQYGQFLMYRPNGRVMGANVGTNTGEFTVCDHRGSAHSKVVIVALSGRPKLSKTKADGTVPSC
jgi:type IV fimbrial biogenesis protein FimT